MIKIVKTKFREETSYRQICKIFFLHKFIGYRKVKDYIILNRV